MPVPESAIAETFTKEFTKRVAISFWLPRFSREPLVVRVGFAKGDEAQSRMASRSCSNGKIESFWFFASLQNLN